MATFVVWVFVYFALRKSVDSIKWVIWFSFPLRIITIIMLLYFGVTLYGSDSGLRQYFNDKTDQGHDSIGEWFAKLVQELQHKEIWIDAA